MKARITDLDINYQNGKGKITLEIDSRYLQRLETFKEKELELNIKEYKEVRNNQANSYMWVILQEMADILKTTKEDLYKKYIKEKGLFRIIKVNNNAVNTMTKIWNDRGLGWFTDIANQGEDDTELILYYGTSSYDTKQMSVFISYICEDAKELGIDTTTLEEQQRLLNM